MEFPDIRDLLLNHLPRVVTDGPVQLSADGLHVDDRGVSIGDLADMLADLTGRDGFLPEGMPVRDITLRDLDLTREEEDGFRLVFTIDWKATEITVADDFPLRATEARFAWAGGQLSADLDVTLQIEEMTLAAHLELPSQVVTVRLTQAEAVTAQPYLERKGLVAGGGGPHLELLLVKGSIPFRHFTLRIELRDLFEIGPVRMTHAEAELTLGRHAEDMRFEAAAVLEIDVSDNDTLTLEAEGEVDDHGWRVAADLVLDGPSHNIGDLIAKATPKGQTPPALPSVISDIALTRIAAEIDTHADTFRFDCTLDWQGDDSDLVIHVEKRDGGVQLAGTLRLGDVVFRLVFDKAAKAVLVASYDAAGAQPLTLDEILAAVGVDIPAALGSGGTGVSIDARAVGVAIEGKDQMLLAADVEAGLDLSALGNLPVLGTLLPDEGRIGVTLKPYYKSKSFTADQQARDLLPGSLGLGDGALKPGFNLAATLELGALTRALPEVQVASPQEIAPAQDGTPPKTGTALAQPSGLEWQDINHSLGPVTIARVGWALSKSKDSISIAFDGELSVAGLSLSLIGLGASYTFSTQEVAPHLQGLNLDMRKGPLAIGGGFLNNDGDFAGKLMIGTKQFSLSALGAFTMLDGAPSMFAFGVLGMPLGGPPFFFVEGLAAGFGVHRRITAPEITEVRSFPLVKAANDTALGAKPDPDPAKQLRALSTYVAPELGQYFFAAGIKFNSFRLLHGTLVAIVQFGRDFEIDIVGTADFSVPPDLPKDTPALARVELDLVARIAPEEGIVSVEARLNPKSYVYSPLCHLSGGFAYKAWFKGDHAGDFVLSVGGYAKQFKKPPHYPDVPRVALKYQITDGIYIKGDGYFALTPSAMMAGGGLHANVEIGSLHAWADLTVDMIVRWEPAHYDAWVHVGIGAKWKCFHTTATADLHIWGPKFSGLAHVEWSVFSFDVEFGPRLPHLPVPIDFDRFKAAFLGWDKTQASLDGTLGLVIAEGQIGQIGEVPVVAGARLALSTSSKVPLTKVLLDGRETDVATGATLGLAPTGGGALGAAVHEISITRNKRAVAKGTFVLGEAPHHSKVPAALWGRDFAPDENAAAIDAAVGVALHPAKTVQEGASQSVSAKNFRMAPAGPVIAVPAARRMLPPAAVAEPEPQVGLRLVLEDFGPEKVDVIKEVRAITGLGLKEAKTLTESGGPLRENLTRDEAERDLAKLEEVGAVARIEAMDAVAPEPEIAQRLVLVSHGPQKVAVIKELRKLTGLRLKEAKDLAEEGGTVLENLSRAEAEAHIATLEGLGAQVALEEMAGVTVVPEPGRAPGAGAVGPFRLELGAFLDEKRVSAIKVIREETGVGLKEAVALFDERRFVVEDLTARDAKALQRRFSSAGVPTTITAQTEARREDAPLKNDLPLTDLRALGLETADLTVAPLRNSRQTVTLRPGGYAVA